MRSNSIKTFFFLVILMALFIFIGGLIGGRSGAIVAFVIALGANFFSYWFSGSIVLKMYKAQVVTDDDQPELVGLVRGLAAKAGMPMPKVAIVPNPTPNAFATGRNPANGVVAVTTGIVQLLNKDELEGVIAHELSHIQGRDTLISTLAASVAGAVMLLADFARMSALFGGMSDRNNNNNALGAVVAILVAILAPIAAMIVQMAISRTREYEADASAARITNKPMALASALNKITYGNQVMPNTQAKEATAHMFIINPLAGKKLSNMFSTHPSTEDRIARLKEMALDTGNKSAKVGYTPKSGGNAMFR